MKRRPLLFGIGALCAGTLVAGAAVTGPALARSGPAGAARVSAAVPVAGAVPAVQAAAAQRAGAASGARPSRATLRSLGDRVGLRIGTAIDPSKLGTNAEYTRIASTEFSSVTAENAMKWESLEPTRGTFTWGAADQVMAFARSNRQLVRGHTLVWHNQLPKWVSPDGTTSPLTAPELKAALKAHIRTLAGRYKGRVWQWDVVNEAFNDDGTPRQTVWYNAWGGLGYVADAFRWAHQADPNALLFYNDYNLEFTGAKSNAVLAFVAELKAAGVPIHGVGFQTHLDTQYGFPDLRANLERFAALGLKVAETEADVRTFTKPAPQVNTPVSGLTQSAQELYWSRALQACLAVKACISFTPWGFGDAFSWIPGFFTGEGAALLYDEQLRPKPQYTVLAENLGLAAGAPRRGRAAGHR